MGFWFLFCTLSIFHSRFASHPFRVNKNPFWGFQVWHVTLKKRGEKEKLKIYEVTDPGRDGL